MQKQAKGNLAPVLKLIACILKKMAGKKHPAGKKTNVRSLNFLHLPG
jgi:hypothetical protein